MRRDFNNVQGLHDYLQGSQVLVIKQLSRRPVAHYPAGRLLIARIMSSTTKSTTFRPQIDLRPAPKLRFFQPCQHYNVHPSNVPCEPPYPGYAVTCAMTAASAPHHLPAHQSFSHPPCHILHSRLPSLCRVPQPHPRMLMISQHFLRDHSLCLIIHC